MTSEWKNEYLVKLYGDKCDDCGRKYFIIYRVPNHIWTKISPKPETLGDYIEHQFGGILCPDCATRKARDIGVTLYFDARESWDDVYHENQELKERLARFEAEEINGQRVKCSADCGCEFGVHEGGTIYCDKCHDGLQKYIWELEQK